MSLMSSFPSDWPFVQLVLYVYLLWSVWWQVEWKMSPSCPALLRTSVSLLLKKGRFMRYFAQPTKKKWMILKFINNQSFTPLHAYFTQPNKLARCRCRCLSTGFTCARREVRKFTFNSDCDGCCVNLTTPFWQTNKSSVRDALYVQGSRIRLVLGCVILHAGAVARSPNL